MIPLLDVSGAARAIRDGGLVALPTETVYGLGGDALNPAAVARIFQVKGRPQFNPIICHLPDAESVFRFGRRSATAEGLSRFWPGPLTLLLPHENRIPSIVTAGSPLAGFRVPDHSLALEFLRACDTPIAAPSANRSGRRSPTSAAMVQADYDREFESDFNIDLRPERTSGGHDGTREAGGPNPGTTESGPRIAGILDGGPCRVGLESTVVAIVSEEPPTIRILRPGGVSAEQLRHAGFRLNQQSDGAGTLPTPADPAAGGGSGDGASIAAGRLSEPATHLHAPGRLLQHYGPGVPLLLIDRGTRRDIHGSAGASHAIKQILREINPSGLPLTWLGFAGRPAPVPCRTSRDLSPEGDFAEAARRLFSDFDQIARSEPTVILCETLPALDLGVAVNDRLTRAATRMISLRE
ncbi:MAG: L-threonylcarbamoyladenylate synthase [Leptospirales bacterium]|jgi:L-threonylcarbamoyladenylate synthase